MLRVEHRCADGSPFPVEFPTEADARVTWRIDLEHTPTAMAPLEEDLVRLGRPGAERAYADSGMRLPSSWRDRPRANGYGYFPDEPMPDEELGALIEGAGRLRERHGSALAVWHEHCLPPTAEACARLRAAAPDTTAAVLAELHDYALNLTMVASWVSMGDLLRVSWSIADLYGDGADLVAHELAQGYDSHTLGADAALWRIARLPEGSLDAEAALEEWLEAYGWQTPTWSIATPTWHERVDVLRDQIRLLGRDDAADPQLAVQAAAARRDELLAEIDVRLGDDADRRAQVRRRVERLAGYVPVREDRARWQLIAAGSLRHAVLQRGRALVTDGVIDDENDVLFLTAAELDAPTGDLRAAVRERKTEHAHWSAVTPPTVIGAGADAATADERIVRGKPGSRGTVTGTARVILDLADADRLQPGDVLVCRSTSPPWTPLFALASAVVSDGGDIASHVAVAAREYGIPCVVGTQRDKVARRSG